MRKLSRLALRGLSHIQARHRLSNEVLGDVADISLGGLCLSSDDPLTIGTELSIRLAVPVREGHARPVDIEVVCLWARKDSRRGKYSQGFSLREPSTEFAELVASLRVAQRLKRHPAG